MFIFDLILYCTLAVLIGGLLPDGWGFVKRALVGLTLLFSINTLFGYLLYVLHLGISSHVYTLMYILMAIGICYKLFVIDKKSFFKIYRWGKADTVVSILSLLLFLVIVFPNTKSHSGIFNIFTPPSEDMVNHFFIANAITQKGGYIYKDSSYKDKMPVDLINYPQAAHYNFAILVGQGKDSSITILKYYRYYYVLCYLVFFAFFMTASTDLLGNKIRKLPQLLIVGLVGLTVFGSSIFAPVYLSGFISQFVSLSLLIALVLSIIKYKDFTNRFFWLFIIILLNGSIAATWYFLTPVALIVSLVAIIRSSYKTKFYSYLLTVLVTLPPILISLSSGKLTQVNASGHIDLIPVEYYLLIIIGCIFALWNYVVAKEKSLKIWAELLIISVFFSFIIMVFQLVTSGHVSYYFLKSVYTPVLVALIIFMVGVSACIYLINKHFSYKNIVLSMTVSLLLGIMVVFGLLYHTDTGTVSFGLLDKKNYTNSQQLARIEDLSVYSKETGNFIIFNRTGSAGSDYIFSKWITALNLNYSDNFSAVLVESTIEPTVNSTRRSDLVRSFGSKIETVNFVNSDK